MVTLEPKFRVIDTAIEDYNLETGVSSIEWFNAACDPYRAAPYGKIPVPYPFSRKPGPVPCSEILEQYDPKIREILRQENITVRIIREEHLYPRYAPASTKDTVVIHTTDVPSEPLGAWAQAANEIYKLLDKPLSAARIKFRVEVRNSELMYQAVSRALPAGLPILPQLLQLQPKINVLVQTRFLDDWTSIGFHLRGPRNDIGVRKPTLLVTFKPSTRLSWPEAKTNLEKEIKDLKAEYSMDFELPVEFISGVTYPGRYSTYPPDPIFQLELPDLAQNGASIGPQNSKSAGSLGVWTLFQSAGKTVKHKCFLTCYHIIDRGWNDHGGIGLYGRLVENRIAVNYPAILDSAHTRRVSNSQLAHNERVEENKKTIALIDRFKSEKGIGYVKYASGFRRNRGSNRLDWALIAPNKNEPSLKNICPPANTIDKVMLSSNPMYAASPNETFTRVGEPELSSWVAKIGRTTNITCGAINAMKRCVNWKEQPDPDSFELEVLPLDFSGAFAAPGDQGSMVFNSKKEWIGMVIGADDSTNVSYITPASHIIEDIRATTGGTITLA